MAALKGRARCSDGKAGKRRHHGNQENQQDMLTESRQERPGTEEEAL